MPAVDVAIQRPKIQDPAVAKVIAQLTELVESLNGVRRGRELDRVLTLRDLVADTEATQIITASGGVAGSIPSSIVTGGTDSTAPGKLTGLSVGSAAVNNILTWSGTSSISNYSYTEVWRNSVDNLSTAVLHGHTAAEVFADDVGQGAVTYYYWVRAVSTTGIPGPFNATAGTSGTTGQVLNGDIADVAIDTAKIADLAVVNAKIADLAVTNAKIGDLAVDAAKIADLAVTNAKIADLAVTNAKIANLAVDTAQIADLAVDTLKLAGQAVTIPISVFTAGSTPTISSTFATIQSASITSTGAPLSIAAAAGIAVPYDSDTGADAIVSWRILRDSTVLVSSTTSSSPLSFSIADTPSAGSHTYYLQIAYPAGTAGSASSRSILLLETKK